MANIFFKKRIYITLIVTLAVWGLLIWDYFHEGVPSHHLLAREDLPSISNWWGGFLLPTLTWFLTWRIQKRLTIDSNSKSIETIPASVFIAYFGSLLFGILLAVFFTLGVSELTGYMMLSVFGVALFFPVYRSECLLGFICGITYTFGGVLPIVIASILALGAVIIYKLIRPVILFVLGKLEAGK